MNPRIVSKSPRESIIPGTFRSGRLVELISVGLRVMIYTMIVGREKHVWIRLKNMSQNHLMNGVPDPIRNNPEALRELREIMISNALDYLQSDKDFFRLWERFEQDLHGLLNCKTGDCFSVEMGLESELRETRLERSETDRIASDRTEGEGVRAERGGEVEFERIRIVEASVTPEILYFTLRVKHFPEGELMRRLVNQIETLFPEQVVPFSQQFSEVFEQSLSSYIDS